MAKGHGENEQQNTAAASAAAELNVYALQVSTDLVVAHDLAHDRVYKALSSLQQLLVSKYVLMSLPPAPQEEEHPAEQKPGTAPAAVEGSAFSSESISQE